MNTHQATKKSDRGRGPARRHPWAEIEALYSQGEDVELAGKDGKLESHHTWPTQTELAARYRIRLDSISRHFALPDSAGLTVHDHRRAFQVEHQRRVNAELLAALAGREVSFRLETMAMAELGLRLISRHLLSPKGADDLAKLLSAGKRAQEIGMVALDLPANGPDGADRLGLEDWTLMSEVRRGKGARRGQGDDRDGDD